MVGVSGSSGGEIDRDSDLGDDSPVVSVVLCVFAKFRSTNLSEVISQSRQRFISSGLWFEEVI